MEGVELLRIKAIGQERRKADDVDQSDEALGRDGPSARREMSAGADRPFLTWRMYSGFAAVRVGGSHATARSPALSPARIGR
jgi:hypothetical protein